LSLVAPEQYVVPGIVVVVVVVPRVLRGRGTHAVVVVVGAAVVVVVGAAVVVVVGAAVVVVVGATVDVGCSVVVVSFTLRFSVVVVWCTTCFT